MKTVPRPAIIVEALGLIEFMNQIHTHTHTQPKERITWSQGPVNLIYSVAGRIS